MVFDLVLERLDTRPQRVLELEDGRRVHSPRQIAQADEDIGQLRGGPFE